MGAGRSHLSQPTSLRLHRRLPPLLLPAVYGSLPGQLARTPSRRNMGFPRPVSTGIILLPQSRCMSVGGSDSTGVVRGPDQPNNYEVTQSSDWHRPDLCLTQQHLGAK